MLAFGHLEIKQQKKIEEIRRILPNLGEFDQIPQIYHEEGNFLSTDGNISALRAGNQETWPTRIKTKKNDSPMQVRRQPLDNKPHAHGLAHA